MKQNRNFLNYSAAIGLGLALLLPACSKTGKDNAAAPGQPAEVRAPYYYGLIEEYKRILAEDPNNLAAIIALGNAYFDSGQWKEAISYYENALRIEPRNADVRTDMGTAYRNMGFPDRALQEYQKALSFEPWHQNARYNIGVVYAYDKKDYAAAIRVWEDLLRHSPNHPRAEQMRLYIIMFKKAVAKETR